MWQGSHEKMGLARIYLRKILQHAIFLGNERLCVSSNLSRNSLDNFSLDDHSQGYTPRRQVPLMDWLKARYEAAVG